MRVQTALIALLFAALLVSGCTQQATSGEEGKPLSPEEKAKLACIDLCNQALEAGRDISDGPCLSDGNWQWNNPDWVCDIAQSPRRPVDDDPANQCQDYRLGKANHFIEIDYNCQFIRAV